MNQERHKTEWEERIRFVARYYRENVFDPEIGWKKFAAERNIRSRVRIPVWIWQIAAVCLLAIGYGIYRMIERNQPEWVVITASSTRGKEVFLADSSQVSLAALAELRYDAKRFGKDNRQVELKGKAFYQVKHREDLPFRVQTHLGNVVVLGTSFLVRELKTAMEVQVLQGRVRMEAGKKKSVLLEAGMSGLYSEMDGSIQVRQEADENCLSWKTGELVFRETPLPKVIHDIEVCYEVKLTDLSGASDSLRLSATFKKKPVEEVLLIINQTLDTHLVIEKSRQ